MNAAEQGKTPDRVSTGVVIRVGILGMIAAIFGCVLSHGVFYLIKGKLVHQFVMDELIYSGRQHPLLVPVVHSIIPWAITITGTVLAWKWLRKKDAAIETPTLVVLVLLFLLAFGGWVATGSLFIKDSRLEMSAQEYVTIAAHAQAARASDRGEAYYLRETTNSSFELSTVVGTSNGLPVRLWLISSPLDQEYVQKFNSSISELKNKTRSRDTGVYQ